MLPVVRAMVLTGAVRVVLAVGAVTVEASMVVAGSRPDAELAGILLPFGLMAAAVTVPYLAVAVTALVALVRTTSGGRRRTVALALVDLLVGGVMSLALVRAVVVSDPVSGSPLWLGLLPLALGAVTLALGRADRRGPAPTAAA